MNDEIFMTARDLLKQGAVADVRRLLASLQNEEATDARVSYLSGVCDFRESDFEKAERHFRDAVSLDGLFVEPRYYIGLCLERCNRFEEARIEYMTVLAMQPDHTGAIWKLAADSSAEGTTGAAPAGDVRRETPVRNQAAASEAESRLVDEGLAKGIYTDRKSKVVYFVEIGFIFAITFVIAGGIAGVLTNLASGNIAIAAIVGLVVGTLAGVVNAGSIKRFK
ncbi:Protein kinase G tetratricopeptide repeat-containing protein [Marinobacter daqiaonensis]|uniref:Protein kinase G tetratricopeptide repeat-containing protein n=1 Tax=Marinobacter daqiaonensis TaxID=650891 RepID=A0A1I6GK95_9GAMM|nr:tetratricopeptide repeat protein [Marinobacter daqiaonensis]SFR42477.1 Protein kinase G tetratricopeptide repeat-containing protein [Marinobacter daqiaonensis]